MRTLLLSFMILTALMFSGCSDADIASQNLSRAADNFEIMRRVVFYNGINGEYMLVIEGLCSRNNENKEGSIGITCKVGPKQYKKHYLGLSDNVTYFIEQTDAAEVSAYHYRVIFKPAAVLPSFEVK